MLTLTEVMEVRKKLTRVVICEGYREPGEPNYWRDDRVPKCLQQLNAAMEKIYHGSDPEEAILTSFTGRLREKCLLSLQQDASDQQTNLD